MTSAPVAAACSNPDLRRDPRAVAAAASEVRHAPPLEMLDTFMVVLLTN